MDTYAYKDSKYARSGRDIIKGIEAGLVARTGILSQDGEFWNGHGDYKYTQNPDFTLTAATNDQVVSSTFNRGWKRLRLAIRSPTAKTSWDFKLETRVPHVGGVWGQFRDHKGTVRWLKEAMTSSAVRIYDDTVPYHPEAPIRLIMDNNHATDAIVIRSSWMFYDPVR